MNLREMKNVSGGFISRLDTVWERICEFWDGSRETIQTKMPREKKYKPEYSRTQFPKL